MAGIVAITHYLTLRARNQEPRIRMKKQSINIYRTIDGIRFEQLGSNPDDFQNFKDESKKLNLKFRIVNGDFLRQIKSTQKVATSQELKERWEKKKNKIETLSSNIGKLRKDISEDLKNNNEKTFLTALAVAIIDKTGERVGNDTSADNGNFGVTGLRKKHIKIQDDLVLLTYRGKSGVDHETSFTSSKLAGALKQAIKNSSGIRVFQTSDGFRIKNDGVNRYLEAYDISAKDIRGFRSNDWIIKGLSKNDIPEAEAARKKIFLSVLKKVAEKIGHGRSTLRNHYMIPEIETSYINDGKIIDISDKETYERGGGIGIRSTLSGIYVTKGENTLSDTNQETGSRTGNKKMKITNDGQKGGLLHGPTDKNGGEGIKAEVIGGSKVILGGGEIIINEEASKQNCEILNEINTSTGGRKINCNLQQFANTKNEIKNDISRKSKTCNGDASNATSNDYRTNEKTDSGDEIEKIKNKYSKEDFYELIEQLEIELSNAMAIKDVIRLRKLNDLIGKVIDQRNASHFDTGGLVSDPEIIQSASRYGWSAIKNSVGDYELFNRKNVKVILIKQKGNKYTFSDMAGNKIMSGNGMIGKSIEKLLSSYYYASPVLSDGGKMDKETPKEDRIKKIAHFKKLKDL